MRIIAEANNRQYYEMRAFELVREAGEALDMDGDPGTYHEKMRMAIGVLALARAVTPVPLTLSGLEL